MDNRTAAFRFIPGDASQRIECRVGGADGNPYLAAAATLGAALLGIEQRIEPPEAVIGNAYDVEDSLPPEWRFPPTLRDAAARFAQSTLPANYSARPSSTTSPPPAYGNPANTNAMWTTGS